MSTAINFHAAKILNKIEESSLIQKGISLSVKREDLVHTLYGGNKFRKLKYNMEQAKSQGCNTLLTFGGAYSNHIAATAFAGKAFGFNTIGIIRGDEIASSPWSSTLKQASDNGMHLQFISRTDYNLRYDSDFLDELSKKYGNPFIIPEGGCNYFGLLGCTEIVEEIETDFDYLVCPVGTGTTLLGIASALKPHQKAIGIEVYKHNLQPQIELLSYVRHNASSSETLRIWKRNTLLFNYAFSGYGKSTPQLDKFCREFEKLHGIVVEPIYSGKMFYGIYQLSSEGFFPAGSRIVALHTGGLQYF